MFFESLSDNTQKRLIRRLEEVNHDIRTRGISRSDNSHSAIAGIQDLLTGYSYGEFYDWDLYYENLYLSHFGIARYCRTNFEAFLDRQLECGFVARTMMEQRMRQHFKPFLAQIAVLGSRQFGRFEWLCLFDKRGYNKNFNDLGRVIPLFPLRSSRRLFDFLAHLFFACFFL